MADRIAFRHRSHEVSRLEAFSDVIFGFAISLLVVSLEAPKSYGELIEMMHGFLPFAICFFIFIDIWWEHHDYFKRYALHDFRSMILNTALLFTILFYVYPLKFMFTMAVNAMAGHRPTLPRGGYATLFTIYGIGVMAVFWILALMYAHAWSKRDELQLNEFERIDTLESVVDNLAMGTFGLLSLIIVRTPLMALAGAVYFFIAVPKTIIPIVMGRKRRRAQAAMEAEAVTVAPDAA